MCAKTLLLSLLLAVCASVAFASDGKVVVETDAKAIVAQQIRIRDEVAAGAPRFRHLGDEQRGALATQQELVLTRLQGVERTTDLSSSQQAELVTALEAIAALVNPSQRKDQVVCERYKPTGSHRPVTVCRTVAEKKQDRDASERDLNRRDQRCVDGWNSNYCVN